MLNPKNVFLFICLICFVGCGSPLNCICPDLYDPVCGANGKNYANPCSADCDNMPYTKGECPTYGIGTVKFSGDTLCGYFIQILDNKYKPQQLAEEFLENGKTVNIKYRRMINFHDCLSQNETYQEIIILEIDEFP